jgi:hypothetical protein
MSDMTPTQAAVETPAASPVAAAATQALAIKELGETVAKVKKQVKTLWIVVIVIAVLSVASLALRFLPGAGFPGRGNFQGRFNQTNGTFQGPAGTTGGGTTNGGGTNGGTVPQP